MIWVNSALKFLEDTLGRPGMIVGITIALAAAALGLYLLVLKIIKHTQEIRNNKRMRQASEDLGERITIREPRNPGHDILPKVAGYTKVGGTDVRKNALKKRTVTTANGKKKTIVHRDENDWPFLVLKTKRGRMKEIPLSSEDAKRIEEAE